jgi:7-carboxy-7-deazaguanine synthase
MRVCEVFKSFQGEGRLVGTPSIFVRFWGCNLKCKWCDEKKCLYKKNIKEIGMNKIISLVEDYNCKHVVITGGEPLLHNEIIDFCNILKDKGYHITLETNGTIIKKNIKVDLISISPKLSNSNPDFADNQQLSSYNQKRLNLDIIKYYMTKYDYQIKFVVKKEDDFKEINEIIFKLKDISIFDEENILVMPLASSRKQLFMIQQRVVNWCLKYNYRYCNRLQLQVWGKGKEKEKVEQWL